jgi:hypothetical protein
MKIKFRSSPLTKSNQAKLATINAIVEEYQAQRLVLTLRQLYYQLVSRDIIPNKQAEYAKLSRILKEGRMSGIVDWDAIEDRLRVVETRPSWDSPKGILESAAYSYQKKRLEGQKNYLEVWVEKDALSGVLSRVTAPYHVPIMVNRGYSSASAMFDAWERFKNVPQKNVTILYLGDHDPSGMDMIRDNYDRIMEFQNGNQGKWFNFEVVPIALTAEQIAQYDPPPNPAKMSDPRAYNYVKEHGDTSWEVDALRPEVLNQLLIDNIESRIDKQLYDEILLLEMSDKDKLDKVAKKYDHQAMQYILRKESL